MKHAKKIAILLAAILPMASFAACGSTDSSKEEAASSASTSEESEAELDETTTVPTNEDQFDFEEETQKIINNNEYTTYDMKYLKIDLPWIERIHVLESGAVDGYQGIWCNQRDLFDSDNTDSVFITVEPDYISDLSHFSDYMEKQSKTIYESKEFESDKLGKVLLYRYQSYKVDPVDYQPVAYYDTYRYAFYDRDKNLITFTIQFPENWSCNYNEMAEHIFQSIELPEGHYPENDFLSVEENQNAYKEYINKGEYANLYSLLRQHLESDNISKNDSAYKAVEILDTINPYLDAVNIEYDEIDKMGTIKYKSVEDISSEIHIVPIAYTNSSELDVTIGFVKSDWLFFDSAIVTGKERNCNISVALKQKIEDVLDGGTIKESSTNPIKAEDLLDISENDKSVIRFTNSNKNQSLDYPLSKSETDAASVIAKFGTANKELYDLLSDYKKYEL